jgi:hypothetical protein
MEPTTESWSSFSENTILWDLDSVHWKSHLWTLMIIPACNFIRIGRKNSALGVGSKPIKLMLHFLWTKILLSRAHTKHLFCICGKKRANAYVEKSQTMIEQDPSRYGKNEIPPMLLEQQPPNNPPNMSEHLLQLLLPPMVTQGHFFHLQHHLLYPFLQGFGNILWQISRWERQTQYPSRETKGFNTKMNIIPLWLD